MERKSRNEDTWTKDEKGNVAADRMASDKPDTWTAGREKEVETITYEAQDILQQMLPGDLWNIYKEGATPISWKYLEEKRKRREHLEYMDHRSTNSEKIGRHRNWRGCNMEMAAKLWRTQKLSKNTRIRVMKILYDQYWHGGNRSKGAPDSEKKRLATCDLCGQKDSQWHIILECTHPTIQAARDHYTQVINSHHRRMATNYNGREQETAQILRCV